MDFILAFSYIHIINIDHIHPSSFLVLLFFPTRPPSTYLSNFLGGDPHELITVVFRGIADGLLMGHRSLVCAYTTKKIY